MDILDQIEAEYLRIAELEIYHTMHCSPGMFQRLRNVIDQEVPSNNVFQYRLEVKVVNFLPNNMIVFINEATKKVKIVLLEGEDVQDNHP
jgi:hypothetical protein